MEDFQNWRATVVAQVRFKPDRAAIEQELTAHYEDHVRDLEWLEYPTELAEKRAVEAMGDPEEIGRSLDPGAQALAGVAVEGQPHSVGGTGYHGGLCRLVPGWSGNGVPAHPGAGRMGGPAASQQLCGVALRRPVGGPGGDQCGNRPVYGRRCGILLKLDSPKEDPEGFLRALVVTEDREPLPQWDGGEWEQNRWILSWGTDGWTHYQCTVILELDHRPERAEITYPYGDHDWTLHVDWGETS